MVGQLRKEQPWSMCTSCLIEPKRGGQGMVGVALRWPAAGAYGSMSQKRVVEETVFSDKIYLVNPTWTRQNRSVNR
jgi:hypothetical protein